MGATHAQHHVLLALHGHDTSTVPTVKDLAAALGVGSPSAVELIARMVTAGLLRRHEDAVDHRRTRLRLTPHGQRVLRTLSEGHLPKQRDLHRANADLLGD